MKGTIVRKRKEHTEFQMKRNKKTWLAVAGAITAGLCILVLTSKGFKSMERSTLLPVKKQAEKVTEMIGSIAQAALQTQKNIAKIRKAFAEEIPDTTKFIIAQRISSVQNADRIIVLDNGVVNGFGTHEELLASNDIYRDVYESQTSGSGDFDEGGAA